MYWAVRNEDNYEIIDGQQRTISICQYVTGVFSFKNMYFHNLQDEEKEKILNYKLSINVCEGSDREKLGWFRTINIAGEKLHPQELRNAVYHGTWTSDAKRFFSKSGCAAYKIAKDYLNGNAIRQEYLETTLKWISSNQIEEYMAKNQNKTSALPLWEYFQKVISWTNETFPKKRKKLMKGLPWGEYYNAYSNLSLNADSLEKQIQVLILYEDVSNQKGIYLYLLSGNEKHLNIRAFGERTKQRVYEKQGGICMRCKNNFELKEMDGDHIIPWKDGGKTVENNCQMLCISCNRKG